MSPIITGIIVGFVVALLSALVNGGWYYMFPRKDRINRETVVHLEQRIDELEREDIAAFDKRLDAATESRKKIYDNFVQRRDCHAAQEQRRREYQQLERRLDGLSVLISEVQRESTATQTIVKLIADRLNISIGGKLPDES